MKAKSRPEAAPENLDQKFSNRVVDASAEWVALADLALAGNGFAEGSVCGAHIVAVSDLVLTEAMANGCTLPEAPTLRRVDGRTVSFFRRAGAR